MSVAGSIAIYQQPASADKYTEKIRALESIISQYQNQAAELNQRANTLQNELDGLTAQKAVIQEQVNLSQAKYDQLIQQIEDTKKKISDNKDALGKILAYMSVDNDISPLEMLASSNNIGDYVDQQSYRSSIQDNLTNTIDQINKLKKQLEDQKVAVERVLLDQQNQRDALAAKEAEQQVLVNQTRGEEAAYQALSASAKAEKEKVQEEQRKAIQNQYGGGGSIQPGSLPAYSQWAGSNCYVDNGGWSHRGYNGIGGDPAGYGCNQCVSYTAWKMGQITGYLPQYWGNANMWPASARKAGYTVSSVPPSPGRPALGVMSVGQYGHIVYIESVNGDGTVDISQYNEWLPGKGYGYFSTRTNVASNKYDTYIYL